MRTIVHLSDIHYGTVDDLIAGRVVEKINEIGPDVVVVSGDRKLIFETDANGVVTKWRVGVPPAIDLVEDCG